MKKKIFLISLVLVVFSSLFSAYFENIPVTLTQPDGTTIECFKSGDEYTNRIHDIDKFTIVLNPKTGYFVYAEKINEKLIPTDKIVGKDRPVGLERNVFVKNRFYELKKENRNIVRAPNHGTFGNLVVFISFADNNNFTQTYDTYYGWIASDEGPSVKDYYLEATYGKLSIETLFLPEQTGEFIVSYQDEHPRNYYSEYSVSNPIGYQNEDIGYARLHECFINALESVANDIPADFILDGDGDGMIDNIIFFVNGGSNNWGDVLWPHMWTIEFDTVYINGKMASIYNLLMEDFLVETGRDVSVLVHEMFHSIGAPDLYHYNHDGYRPVGYWDIMERDAKQHMSSYMKFRYGNWITDIPVITESGTYWLKPLTSPTDNVFKVFSSGSPFEYFLLEYRRQEGLYESNVPGSGLVAYKVNYNYIGYGNVEGELGGVYNELIAFRPNGSVENTGQINNAFLSLESGRTAIGQNELIFPFLENGNYGGLEISNVTSAGDSIGFDIVITGTVNPKYPPRNLIGQLIEGTRNVSLTWETPLETNGLLGFLVFRDDAMTPISQLLNTTSFVDINVQDGVFGNLHYYAVVAIYSGNQMSEPSNFAFVYVVETTNDEDMTSVYFNTTLYNNYPNPFNPETKIQFEVKNTDNVNISIFNIKGQLVQTLVNDVYTPGRYNLIWNAKNVSSGVYFYKMETNDFTDIKKMLLIK